MHTIEIDWDGPFSVVKVIKDFHNGGNNQNDYDGYDYGLYQIYGKHILYESNSLLYIGKAVRQTFSARLKQHKKWWLEDESEIQVYLGRVYNPRKHSKKDNWRTWERDIETAEKILIYKYSPNYNSLSVAEKPLLDKKTRLLHSGEPNRLHRIDLPSDL